MVCLKLRPPPRSTRTATRFPDATRFRSADRNWNSTGEDVARELKKGDTLEAVVLAVDPERERISLGVQQLEQDPFGQFMAAHPRGTKVSGTVKEVDAKGAVIELADSVAGSVAARDIAEKRVEEPSQRLQCGDPLRAQAN